jgi:hypothetical protein
MAGPDKAREPLPSIPVDVDPFVDSAKTADPAKIAEQLCHANQQLELTRRYPGRERAQPRGKVIETVVRLAACSAASD